MVPVVFAPPAAPAPRASTKKPIVIDDFKKKKKKTELVTAEDSVEDKLGRWVGYGDIAGSTISSLSVLPTLVRRPQIHV